MKTINLDITKKNNVSLEIQKKPNILLDFRNGGGTNNYNTLINKPAINGETLIGDKSFEELGVNTMDNFEILNIFNRVFGG